NDVRSAGSDPRSAAATLKQITDRRAGMRGMFGGMAREASIYDVTAFGWHGAGEVLEAVADLAAR
ncbi:MAG TPA: hypothetical protein VGK73_12440, partial [Polyangiaceae bacterium]